MAGEAPGHTLQPTALVHEAFLHSLMNKMASADRLIEVFDQAKARPAGAERDHYLSGACRSETELKEQGLSLLQAHEGAGDFLKSPQFPVAVVLTEKPGDWIGRYKSLQKLGEGGCGVAQK
jgi:hypothetical protein